MDFSFFFIISLIFSFLPLHFIPIVLVFLLSQHKKAKSILIFGQAHFPASFELNWRVPNSNI